MTAVLAIQMDDTERDKYVERKGIVKFLIRSALLSFPTAINRETIHSEIKSLMPDCSDFEISIALTNLCRNNEIRFAREDMSYQAENGEYKTETVIVFQLI